MRAVPQRVGVLNARRRQLRSVEGLSPHVDQLAPLPETERREVLAVVERVFLDELNSLGEDDRLEATKLKAVLPDAFQLRAGLEDQLTQVLAV